MSFLEASYCLYDISVSSFFFVIFILYVLLFYIMFNMLYVCVGGGGLGMFVVCNCKIKINRILKKKHKIIMIHYIIY